MSYDSWPDVERTRAALLAVAVLGAVLYPLRQYARPADQRVDGFPLSYYPMFTARRSRRKELHFVIAEDQYGGRRYLPYRLLGAGGLNQVRRQLNRVVDSNRAAGFAAALAERVAAERGFEDVTRVAILRGTFDLDDCMLSGRIQGEETVLAEAEVRRVGGDGLGRV
jgi:hypothetical protein